MIPAEEKSKPEMNLADRNNPCGEKKQARDAFAEEHASFSTEISRWRYQGGWRAS